MLVNGTSVWMRKEMDLRELMKKYAWIRREVLIFKNWMKICQMDISTSKHLGREVKGYLKENVYRVLVIIKDT